MATILQVFAQSSEESITWSPDHVSRPRGGMALEIIHGFLPETGDVLLYSHVQLL